MSSIVPPGAGSGVSAYPARGEQTFLVWDTHRQTVAHALRKVAEIKRRGATVIGCSLDAQVKRTYHCPVCGRAGLSK